MSQQGPILVVSTARQPSFASALDVANLFPVVETSPMDAARAVEQMQPAAVLVATSDIDEAGLAALADADRDAPALSAADCRRSADPASRQRHPVLSEPRGLRPACGPVARRTSRPVAACHRHATAGAVSADRAVAHRSRPRCHRAAGRPRQRLSCAIGFARRVHRRRRRALDRSRGEASQRPRHRRHRRRPKVSARAWSTPSSRCWRRMPASAISPSW